MSKLCQYPGCEAGSGFAVVDKHYCRKHYVAIMRKGADHDQRVFSLAKVKQHLLHGPHAGANITAKLSKVDSVYWLRMTHEDDSGATKTITFQNLSRTDLHALADFFVSVADEMREV